MKKVFITATLLLGMGLCVPQTADAQFGNIMGKVKNKLKEKITDKIDQKIEKMTTNIVDGTDETINGSIKDVVSGNGESSSSSNEGAVQEETVKDAQVDFSKSDFKRGSQVFFEDLLDNEKNGEFPSKWDFVNGEDCEVAVLNGKKCIKLGADCSIAPLMTKEDYLPEEFTLEYDVYVIKSDAVGANCYLGPFFRNQNDDFIMDTHFAPMYPHCWGWYGSYHSSVDGSNRDFKSSEDNINKALKGGQWNHVAISFNKRAMKMYINGIRFVNIPNLAQPTRFTIRTWCEMDEKNPYYYMTNIIIAKGAVELYGQQVTNGMDVITKAMNETGKFVTNNILFETGKADIKAESMEEIQKVANYMKANPSVRFEVQGHCDNQGSDKVNDPLSQKRSEAIVNALVGMGVDEFNLKAVGKGSHVPVADNKTEEGRAKNRRVEFIKR